MNIVKKQNPDTTDDSAPPPTMPPVLPPLRTFVLRYRPLELALYRTVEAHGLHVDESSRLAQFVVFVPYENKVTQAPRLIVNMDELVDIEELNPAFPVIPKH